MVKCKNCGHEAHFHKFMGNCASVCTCEAVVSWYPKKKLCDCRKYEPVVEAKY